MDHSFPNSIDDFEVYAKSQGYPNSQSYQNSQNFPISKDYEPFLVFSTPNQVSATQNTQSSKQSGENPIGDKWDVDEDVALISAWINASEDNIRGKNKKGASLWATVKELYDATQAENPNPKKVSNGNISQIKGRWKRINKSAQKWVAAFLEAYRQKRSGMSMQDVENDAHKIYEAGRSKFTDYIVLNTVMCIHKKWELQLCQGTTRIEREANDEESGGSTKRSQTSEEGDYYVPSNPETPTSGGSSCERTTGRNMAKKKGKGKVSNEMLDEIRALRLTRIDELDVMRKRLEFDKEKEQNKKEQDLKKMQLKLLYTLLAKEHLSPEDENTKRFLLSKLYGM